MHFDFTAIAICNLFQCCHESKTLILIINTGSYNIACLYIWFKNEHLIQDFTFGFWRGKMSFYVETPPRTATTNDLSLL
jgi:hypothetical protein